jgi:type II secretory pathway component GspD/PulD (secretin)
VKPQVLAAALLFLLSSTAGAAMTVRRSTESAKLLDVTIKNEPLSVVANALGMYVPRPIVIELESDPLVSYRARDISPDAALRGVARAIGAALVLDTDVFVLRDPRVGSGVSLDVKDADVRVILRTMQKQCGIRNLVLDDNVQGAGTFLFRDVPCKAAFRTVLTSMHLSMSSSYANGLMQVSRESDVR